MSNVLRRPMFRGGPVNSYNIGIASGLGDEGYAEGGRVGFKEGELVTRPSIGSRFASSAKYYNPFTESGISNIGRKVFTGGPGMLLRGAGAIGATYPLLSTLAVPATAIGGLAYLNKPENQAELDFMRENREILDKETTDPNLYEGYFKGRAEARERGEKTGQPKLGFFETFTKEPKQTETQPKEKSELDKLKEFYENEQKKLKEKYENQISGLTKVTPLSDEEDIKKQTELYQRLLGGDEAKKQSIYDALLAASPAFFKGKNLREAAPEVLTAINKSGAFDKPRDIKQAAAQLAIQRQMMKDKAVAEERSRLEYLRLQQGFKEPSVTDRLVKLGAQESFGGNLPSDVKKAVPGKYYVDANGKLIKVVQDPKTKQIDFIEYPD